MKIYKRGKRRVIITNVFIHKDGSASIEYKEIGNISQFYIYLPVESSFDDYFIDTNEELEDEMKRYKTDFDCKQKELKTGAIRSDPIGKGRFDLIPYGPLKRVAQVYERGADKHGERNWEKGFSTGRGIDSAIRHIYQHAYGRDDEDHLAQAIWNLFAVMNFEMQIEKGKLSKDLDTLPKYYHKDDLDEYIEKRSKENSEFKAAIRKVEARKTNEYPKHTIENLPNEKIIKEKDFSHQDVDSLPNENIEKTLEKGRKGSGYNQYPNGWKKIILRLVPVVAGGNKMSRIGIRKPKTIKNQVLEHKVLTKNRANGIAYKFEDPAEYLLGTIGSAMFVEPKYYKDTKNLNELKNRDFNTAGLDEQAVKIVNACFEIAEGSSPKDLLALAHWARVELNMRTTPQVMLAVAAKHENTKRYVRRYVPLVARRADDVLQIVAAYEHLFGWKGFPACLKKGISDRLSKMTEYEILKYNKDGHPSFKDLLRFCERKKGYPFPEAIREYILKGSIVDPDATPMIAARKELTSRKTWGNDIPELAKRSGVTWEVLISQFGNDKRVWEAVIPNMGYMALLRNVGNFLSANISTEMTRFVSDKLSNPEAVARSRQLPFRFLSAYRTLYPDPNNWFSGIVKQSVARDRSAWDDRKLRIMLEGIETAINCSAENIPILPGISCIVADNSGSMTYPLSQKSAVTLRDAANVLCAIIHRRSEESYVGAFGSNVVWPPLTTHNSVLTNMQKIATYNERQRGNATDAWKIFDYLLRKGTKVDRIIVLSDMQCYDSSTRLNWRIGRNVSELLKRYRREINPNVYAHFFDLKSYGSRQIESDDPLTNVVAGFSEKIFDQILIHEGTMPIGGRELPSLDYVRENF